MVRGCLVFDGVWKSLRFVAQGRVSHPIYSGKTDVLQEQGSRPGSPSRPRCEGVITGDVLASPASSSGFRGPVWALTPLPLCRASPSSQQPALLAVPRAGFWSVSVASSGLGTGCRHPSFHPMSLSSRPLACHEATGRATPRGSLPLAAERKAVCAGVSEATHFLERPQPDPGRAGD